MRVGALNILVLGGSSEGFALAEALARCGGVRTVTSLAGVARERRQAAGEVRVGGFGGAEGLRRYLVDERVDAVIDATHPFADRITSNAVAACAETRVPLLRIERPAWVPQAGDRWTQVASMEEAARALPAEAGPVFLTIGRMELAAFAARRDLAFIARMIDPPEPDPGIARLQIVFARGPFDLAAELDFLARHAIACVVTKNAGGAAAAPKLEACRILGLPVVMVARPAMPASGERVDSVEGALAWLARRFDLPALQRERSALA